MDGVDATVWFVYTFVWPTNQTYTVPSVTRLGFYAEIQIMLGT